MASRDLFSEWTLSQLQVRGIDIGAMHFDKVKLIWDVYKCLCLTAPSPGLHHREWGRRTLRQEQGRLDHRSRPPRRKSTLYV